jgi:hypothetical protein
MKPGKGRGGLFVVAGEVDSALGGEERFLGRFSAADLRAELQQAGLLAGLEAKGYASVSVEISRTEDEHRMLLRATSAAHASLPPLVELRCAEETLLAASIEPRPDGFDVLSVLSIRWLEMQDPQAHFTPERPRLPGQRHPGLGLTKPLILKIHEWARSWGKDALVNFPEFFHNAAFYSKFYRFASPVRQGRFEAMLRDLASHSIAVASAAAQQGLVIEEPADRVAHWEPGEMVVGMTAPVTAWLESAAYREAAAAVRDSIWFRIGGLAA